MPDHDKPFVDADGTLHERYEVKIYLGHRYYGSFALCPGCRPDLGFDRLSKAFFCPYCGELWARLVFTGAAGEVNPFRLIEASCFKHPDQWRIPGSLLAAGDLLDQLPDDVVLREAAVHLAVVEKET